MTQAFRIPQTFRLANRTWRVFVEPFEEDNVGGRTSASEATIQLDPWLFEPGREVWLRHIWEHELLHALLFAHGVLNDEHDETFVHGVSGLRVQFEETQKGTVRVPHKKKAP